MSLLSCPHLLSPDVPDDPVHDGDGLHRVVGHGDLVKAGAAELAGQLTTFSHADLMGGASKGGGGGVRQS